MGNVLDFMSSHLKLLLPLSTHRGACPQSNISGDTRVPEWGCIRGTKSPRLGTHQRSALMPMFRGHVEPSASHLEAGA